MFTGLVEEIGTVESVRWSGGGMILAISAGLLIGDLSLGDSVAVDGVCLTVDTRLEGGFGSRVMPETARKTTLGDLRPGQRVNLERALALGSRLGGHLVLGHVDGVGRVISMASQGEAMLLTAAAPRDVVPYLVPRGSVAIDGVSLTLARVQGDQFQVSLVRHTLDKTTLNNLERGDRLNLESDIIGKYVKSMLDTYAGGGGIDTALLREHGWIT